MGMDLGERAPRFLGAAFLAVVVTSLAGGLLFESVVGSGDMSDILVNISANAGLMRLSILVDLMTSLGVILLASLLYVVLREESRILALVALGWWLGEALSLAFSKTAAAALIPLSRYFVQAGAPDASFHQALGTFLHCKGPDSLTVI